MGIPTPGKYGLYIEMGPVYLLLQQAAKLFIIKDWWQKEPGHQQTWYRPSAPRTWWHHQMETISALLTICVGNSPVTGEFPAQRPVTRSFGVFFDLGLNERLSKQSRGRWFETQSCTLWRHSNDFAFSAQEGLAWRFSSVVSTSCSGIPI